MNMKTINMMLMLVVGVVIRSRTQQQVFSLCTLLLCVLPSKPTVFFRTLHYCCTFSRLMFSVSRPNVFSLLRPNVCQDPLCNCSCSLFSPPLKNPSARPRDLLGSFLRAGLQEREPQEPPEIQIIKYNRSTVSLWPEMNEVLTARRSC